MSYYEGVHNYYLAARSYMRKKGFTLAEALIALGIVGIVAALALPMFNKTKPDSVKVAYLKTYDSIVTTLIGIPLYAGPNNTSKSSP